MNLELRPPTEQDLKNLGECLERDGQHGSLEEWKESGAELITFYDEQGPVFHIALQRGLRIFLQHDQGRDLDTRKAAMTEAIQWLKGQAKDKGIKELIFESTIKPVIGFFSQFGFNASPNEQKVKL